MHRLVWTLILLALLIPMPADAADSRWQITAYCANACCCGKWARLNPGITASGARVREGVTVAVDPRIIPLGSLVAIEGLGVYVAQDTGSSVKGRVVDVYMRSHADAVRFGRQKRRVWVFSREEALRVSRGGWTRRMDMTLLLPRL